MLDDEDKTLLDMFAPEYGGRSSAIRQGLRERARLYKPDPDFAEELSYSFNSTISVAATSQRRRAE